MNLKSIHSTIDVYRVYTLVRKSIHDSVTASIRRSVEDSIWHSASSSLHDTIIVSFKRKLS